MFCDKCGNQLRDGAQFCHKCGASVSELEKYQNKASQNQAQTAQQAQAVNQTPKQQVVYQPVYQPQTRPYYSPGTHPYHRLGGFLMFTVVISYISGVSSFVNVISTIISYSGILKGMGNWLPGGFKTWIVLNMIVFSILQLSAGIISISFANKIRRKESDFLHFIQSTSITLIIIMIIWFMISFIWIKQYDQYGAISWGSLIGILIAMVIGAIIGVVLGSVYYGCSVRVRTYMGSDTYLKQSVFNKNSHPIPADGSDLPHPKQNARSRSFDPNTEWVCSECNRINANYVTTCKCGEPKPKKSVPKSWKCNNCGTVNPGGLYSCAACGNSKDAETTWVCSNCGTKNPVSASSCSVCYTSKGSTKAKQRIGQRDWQCPECKKINPGYVTTCTCGCPSSMGIKLDTYSGGNAPEAERQPSANEWKCPNCGRINANYVGTCGCGQVKP